MKAATLKLTQKEEWVINNNEDNIIKLGAGQIPLRELGIWLESRCYNKELIIQYVKDIYDVDITNEDINNCELCFNNNKDVFTYFDEKYPPKTPQENTREWFNKYGRRRYQSFYNKFVENDNVIYDEIINFSQISHHVHHILPLEFDGTNDPKNLIGVITLFHNLLHINPLQHIEKYCYQSVDYLRYLMHSQLITIWKKYNVDMFDEDVKQKIFETGLENEMKLFYDKLINTVEVELEV